MMLILARIKEAIDFAKPYKPDAFLAVGGGSVIDTAKLMNLYTNFPGKSSLSVLEVLSSQLILPRRRIPRLRQRSPWQRPSNNQTSVSSHRRSYNSRYR